MKGAPSLIDALLLRAVGPNRMRPACMYTYRLLLMEIGIR